MWLTSVILYFCYISVAGMCFWIVTFLLLECKCIWLTSVTLYVTFLSLYVFFVSFCLKSEGNANRVHNMAALLF